MPCGLRMGRSSASKPKKANSEVSGGSVASRISVSRKSEMPGLGISLGELMEQENISFEEARQLYQVMKSSEESASAGPKPKARVSKNTSADVLDEDEEMQEEEAGDAEDCGEGATPSAKKLKAGAKGVAKAKARGKAAAKPKAKAKTKGKATSKAAAKPSLQRKNAREEIEEEDPDEEEMEVEPKSKKAKKEHKKDTKNKSATSIHKEPQQEEDEENAGEEWWPAAEEWDDYGAEDLDGEPWYSDEEEELERFRAERAMARAANLPEENPAEKAACDLLLASMLTETSS